MRDTFIAGLAQAIKDEIDELTPDVEETTEPQMLGRVIEYRKAYFPKREDGIITNSDRYGGLESVQVIELGAITWVPAATSDKIMDAMRAQGLNPQRQPSTTAPSMVRKTTTAPITKRLVRKTSVRTLPQGGVGAKPRSAAEIELEKMRVQTEAAGKTQPDMLSSTVDKFVKLGMIGLSAVVLVNVLPSLLEAIKPRTKTT